MYGILCIKESWGDCTCAVDLECRRPAAGLRIKRDVWTCDRLTAPPPCRLRVKAGIITTWRCLLRFLSVCIHNIRSTESRLSFKTHISSYLQYFEEKMAMRRRRRNQLPSVFKRCNKLVLLFLIIVSCKEHIDGQTLSSSSESSPINQQK